MTLIIGATGFGCVAIILSRGNGARRFSQEVERSGLEVYAAFDWAQLRDSSGRLVRDFENGCVGRRDGLIGIWEKSGGSDDPGFLDSRGEILEVGAEYLFRFGCYPVILIRLSGGRVIRVRPVKSTMPAWRIGMSRREAHAAILQIRNT